MSKPNTTAEPLSVAEWLAGHLDEVRAWPAVGTPKTCLVEVCENASLANGLCKRHLERARYQARRGADPASGGTSGGGR